MFYCFPVIYNYGHCKSKQTGDVPVHSLVVIGEHVSVLVGKHVVVKINVNLQKCLMSTYHITYKECGASRGLTKIWFFLN